MSIARSLAVLLALIPFHATAQKAPEPGGMPPELRKLFDREVKPLGKKRFATETGLSGTVEAAAAPALAARDEMLELTVPIGTDQPVVCTFAGERLDPGAWIWRLTEALRENLELLAVQPRDIAVVRGFPLVFVEAIYATQAKNGKLIGQLKIAVLAHEAHMFLCNHDEPGYAESFRRIVTGLAEGLRGGGEDGREGARWAEVSLTRVGGRAVGFGETVRWDRKGGGTVSESRSMQLFPRSPTELVAMDSFHQEEWDDADLVVGGSWVEAENGEVSEQLTLTRKDASTFAYSGKKSGKPLEGTFRAKAGLASDRWFARRFAAGAKPVPEAKHEAYSTDADPTRPIVVTYGAVKGSRGRVQVSAGPLTFAGDVDAHGEFVKAAVPIGPVELVMERAWSQGEP